MVTYRTDDPARWGVGKGSNLTAPEIDGNFWELAQRLVAVETNAPEPNNIASISVVGSQMTVHMEDGSTHGPFTLPTAMIHYRGDWAAGVSYAELDVVAAPNDEGMFLSTRAHVSAATFDRAAVDAAGSPLYQWLFPVAGAATLGELTDVFVSAVELGQTVTWDGSVWVPGYIPSRLQDLNEVYFPAAPATGQFLGWDGWQWTPVDPPAGGGGGQHMWRMRFVNSRTGWHNVREIQFRTAAGVARAATDASVIASDRWGSPERAIDGLTNNYTSLDSPVAGEYLGAAFPQFVDVVEFAINPYQAAFSAVDLDVEHSTDGGLTWEVAGQIRGATLSDGVWSAFPVAIPADAGGGSTTFLGLSDTPAAFGAAGTLAAVNAAGDALEFIPPPPGGSGDLTGLSDVTIATPAAAQFLRHNGAEWANAALAWADIPDKPATFPADAHTHSYGSLTDVPATFAPSAHSHDWASITGKPGTAEQLPPTIGAAGDVLKVNSNGTGLLWALDETGAGGGSSATMLDDLTDVALNAPAIGQVLKFDGTNWTNQPDEGSNVGINLDDIADVQIATPAVGQFLRYDGAAWVNSVVGWAEVTSKPTVFPPSTHSHLWAEISDKPATFPPSAHTHVWADVTGRPATIDAVPGTFGAAGQLLKVNSTADGFVWASDDTGTAGGGGVFRGFRSVITAEQAIPAATFMEAAFGTEVFDTEAAFAANRFTVPASLDGAFMEFTTGSRLSTSPNLHALYVRRSSDGGATWTELAQGNIPNADSCIVTTGALKVVAGEIYSVWIYLGGASTRVNDLRNFFAGHVLGG